MSRRPVPPLSALEQECRAWAEAVGATEKCLQAALSYVAVLHEGMEESNLLGFRTADKLILESLADGYALASELREPGQLVDVGSGAGLPGVGMALRWPEVQCFLVEPRSLRARFLERAVESADLQNVAVVQAKVPLWRPPQGIQTLYVGRAVAPPARFRSWLAPLCSVGDEVYTLADPGGARGWEDAPYRSYDRRRMAARWVPR